MAPTIIPRYQVAQQLAVSVRVLQRYESRGLLRVVLEGGVEGYEPSQIPRIWTIVTCQRDLGINLAGVEAILKLRDHMTEVHRRIDLLAHELDKALEADDDA